MYRDGRVRRAGVAGALLALACGLSGCNLPGTSSGQAASTHATATMTGTWTYKTATTDERLHVKQDRSGALIGDGTSAVAAGGGQVDHSSISVHTGKVKGSAVSLTLYVTPIDWGSGVTAVEYLTCRLSGRTLDCHMNLPLFHVKNAPQTFHKA